MGFSSNTLALFLPFVLTNHVTTTVKTTTHAFVPSSPVPLIRPAIRGRLDTELGYIKEGYDTGIGPDFLKKQKTAGGPVPRPRRRRKTWGEINIEDPDDDIIDAVVIDEHYVVSSKPKRHTAPSPTSTERKPFLDDTTATGADAVAVDDVVDRLKRELHSNPQADVIPVGFHPDVVEKFREELHPVSPPDVIPVDSYPSERRGGGGTATNRPGIWNHPDARTIQGGGSVRTWPIDASGVENTQVLLRAERGCPLRAQIDVWNGPGHAPMKMAVYCADSQPFSCIIPTPARTSLHQSIGIKNSGPMEFPFKALVIPDVDSAMARREREEEEEAQQQQHRSHQYQQEQNRYNSVNPNNFQVATQSTKPKPPASGLGLFAESLRSLGNLRRIDGSTPVDYVSSGGGKLKNEEAFGFGADVDSVQVLIETNGLSCQARIEVTFDDDDDDETIQQVVELSIEDGKERPFFAVLDTPWKRPKTVTVINLDPYSAFQITACVEPYTIRGDKDDEDDGEYGDGSVTVDAAGVDVDDDDDDDRYTFPDITIPATDIDYDFDEDFFFATREEPLEATATTTAAPHQG